MHKYVEALKEERHACVRAGKHDRVASIDELLAALGAAPEVEVAAVAVDAEVAAVKKAAKRRKV